MTTTATAWTAPTYYLDEDTLLNYMEGARKEGINFCFNNVVSFDAERGRVTLQYKMDDSELKKFARHRRKFNRGLFP